LRWRRGSGIALAVSNRGIELLWPGKASAALDAAAATLVPVERHGAPDSPNLLVHGDNLEAMRALLPRYEGKVDLVYIDPPFATNLRYYAQAQVGDGEVVRDAYRDPGGSGMAGYLSAMHPRLALIHRLLAPEGKLFLHCDWRANALLRLVLDELFGPDCFRNEIVWRRAPNLGRQAASRQLGRVVDTIFVYSKSEGALFRGEAPRKSNPVELDRQGKPKGARWDELAGAYFTTAPRGDYTDKSIAELRTQNRVYDSSAGKIYIKYFLRKDESGRWVKDQPVDTLWDDYDVRPLRHRPKGEEMGYDTQKPEGLLERILGWATKPGDLVADFYAGSGTTLAVAEKMGRRWLGSDVGRPAVDIIRRRLLGLATPAAFTLSVPRTGNGEGAATGTSTAAVDVAVRHADGGLRLELTNLRTAERAPQRHAQALSWAESIESWMVDFRGEGVFSPTFVAHRDATGTVPLVTPYLPRESLGAQARVVVHTVHGETAERALALDPAT